MFLHKYFILPLILIALFANVNNTQKSRKTGGEKLKKKTELKKTVDSIDVTNAAEYILNNKTEFAEEIKKIEKYPYSSGRTLLYSLLLKKENKYLEMYDSLYNGLEYSPRNFLYYDELVFSSNAAGTLYLLDEKLKSIELLPLYKTYLSAIILEAEGKYSDAIKLLTPAAEKNDTIPYLNYKLSILYKNSSSYSKSLQKLKLAGAKQSRNIAYKIKLLLAEGNLHFFNASYSNANKLYSQALKLAGKNKLLYYYSKAQISGAILNDIKGNYSAALKGFREGLKTAKEIQNTELQASAYSELGVSYTYSGNMVKAKNCYLTAYYMFKQLNNKQRVSLLCENLGKMYIALSDYTAAINFLEEGLKTAGEDKRAYALNLVSIGDAYSNLSNYAKAIKYYREAEKISIQIKADEIVSSVNGSLGMLNYNLGKYNSSLAYFRISDSINTAAGLEHLRADAYYKLGLSYSALDSTKKALDYLSEAIKLAEKKKDYTTEYFASIELALMASRIPDYTTAFNAIGRAYSSAGKLESLVYQTYTALTEAEIYLNMGSYEKSLSSGQKSYFYAKELNSRNLMIESGYIIAKSYEMTGNLSSAAAQYEEAVKLIDKVSSSLINDTEIQINYFSSKSEVYYSYINMLLQQKKFEKAFIMIEKQRSRNLYQNLVLQKVRSISGAGNEAEKLFDYEWNIESGIYSGKELLAFEDKYKKLKEELINKHPELSRYLEPLKIKGYQDVRNVLSENEKYISMWVGGKKTYIFLAGKEGVKCIPVNKGKAEIEKLVSLISPYYDKKVKNEVANQDLFAFNSKSAFNLYNTVFKNVFENIPKDSKVIAALPEELFNLPLDFLVTEYGENESDFAYDEKKFLLMDYSISYIPSISVLQHEKESKIKTQGKALLIGNPTIKTFFGDYADRRGLLEDKVDIPRNIPLLPLKYSGDEINGISDILENEQVLLEDDATETNFKKNASGSRIIHLSTHSFLYNKQPVIFFSNKDDFENDGFLEAGEISGMKLNAGLVVLSSCNSGLGEVDRSEGVLGMSKAFLETGAKSVVVSLWEVNDKYTSKLMQMFYENLSSGLTKTEALQKAKKEFISEYSANPYYWASFVLTGDIESMYPAKNKPGLNFGLTLLLVLVFLSAVVYYIKRKSPSKRTR